MDTFTHSFLFGFESVDMTPCLICYQTLSFVSAACAELSSDYSPVM